MKKLLSIILLGMLLILPNFVYAKVIKVGITQIVEHPALDACRKGIIDKLKELGYIEGKNIEYDIQIAQGNIATANQIAKKFVGDKKDIIIAIATPTALAVANATKKIPIVISAITDPVGAKLVKSLERPGTNVTGTTDMSPVKEQLNLFNELNIKVKNIGVIYNAGEANSRTLVKLTKKYSKEYGWNVVEATVTNSSGVLMAAKSLVGRVDGIYIPTDNTVVSALEAVLQVAYDNKIPVITGDTDSVERGALASLGMNYYKLGLQTGEIVYKIIHGANPATTPVETLKDLELFINLKAAKKMGVNVPEEMIKKATKVIK
ncbi:ABC transporter substrate-binding protein [Deferribacter autotrophicus]|uniref:ABC transporter substrate-binding protein n=1 Tax=Deferribacter autotrophicus TaxID=500465 RepID=A0A5A8F5J8_9BACT|nr:ABC transporter substrate-binding protein [Deferribacter autotrophicus]KAA0257984.1 ABC transporter substrate-binding protein [Deferribacter autotrophicus]